MSNRVSPGRKAAVGTEELAVTSPKLDLAVAISNGFPLDGGIKAAGESLEDFAACHAEEKWLIGGREVLVVTALEADYVVVNVIVVGEEFDGPAGVLGGSVAVLADGFFVFFSCQVLVVVTPEADCLGVLEEIHCRCLLMNLK